MSSRCAKCQATRACVVAPALLVLDIERGARRAEEQLA
jgi:hypothetical protein